MVSVRYGSTMLGWDLVVSWVDRMVGWLSEKERRRARARAHLIVRLDISMQGGTEDESVMPDWKGFSSLRRNLNFSEF